MRTKGHYPLQALPHRRLTSLASIVECACRPHGRCVGAKALDTPYIELKVGSCLLDTPCCRFDAPKGPLGASRRIVVELCVSLSCIRGFSDFPTHAGAGMEFENHSRKMTQVTARQSEAARSEGSWWRCRRLKKCALAHMPDR